MKQHHQYQPNQFNVENEIVYMTIESKKGKQLVTKFDIDDFEKVKEMGTWYAQWDKDFNAYVVLCSTQIKKGNAIKHLKSTLQSVILGTSTNAPIRHLNGDLLDNKKENLEVYNRKQKNEFEKLENDVISIYLKNRYGNVEGKTIIDAQDLQSVVCDNFTWIMQKYSNGQPYVIAHTENGRIHLDKLIANPNENQYVYHINKNPLDNRRINLELKEIEQPQESK